MQDRPDKTALLGAVVRFLEEDLKGAIKDPSLAYRLKVAANVVRIVAHEIQVEAPKRAAELESLQDILQARTELLDRLNAELARRIRAREFSAEELQRVASHVKRSLAADLAIANPRFDTSTEIE
jgi:hypothetical protein